MKALIATWQRCLRSRVRCSIDRRLGCGNGRLWHIAAFAAPQTFVAYWGNNGQRAARSLNRYAAFDPFRNSGPTSPLTGSIRATKIFLVVLGAAVFGGELCMPKDLNLSITPQLARGRLATGFFNPLGR